jgi:hypothetical protein
MSRKTVFAPVAALALGIAAGCGSSPSGPTPVPGPGSSPSPVVTSVSVEGASSAEPGEPQQLRAMAQMSDGAARDVSTQAAWLSSDPAVATVSATGLVTPLKTGTTDVAASYQGHTGRRTLVVGSTRWDVRIALSSFTALETCDDVTQGLDQMEVAYKVSVVLPDGRESVLADTGHPGSPSGSQLGGAVRLRAGQVVRLSQERTFGLPGESGQFARVEFRATEWDEQIVLIPPSIRWVRDGRMNDREGVRSHAYSSGAWSGLGNNSITLGSSGCRVRLDYQASATRR